MIDANKLFSLPIIKSLTNFVSEVKINDVPIILIEHPYFKAAIAKQGAHLLYWQPKEAEPVIWLSEKVEFSLGKIIRGGVPICWPWFGRKAKPIHGFARDLLWELTAIKVEVDKVVMMLTLSDSEQTRVLWDHQFTLTAQITLSQHQCDITLKSEGDFSYTGGFHSYFNVSEVGEISLTNMMCCYKDSLLPNDIGWQQENRQKIMFTQAIDRVYKGVIDPIVINDPLYQREIHVKHHHVDNVVVWNPWHQGSKSMVDMSDSGYKTMICVEPAQVEEPLWATSSIPSWIKMSISVLCYP